jgi:hypothetical protein
VTRKKKSVVLTRLAEDSRAELNEMVLELSGGNSAPKGVADKPGRKQRRFAASGKFNMN